MSNPYLEKAASLYDFWNDLTGKEHSDLKARKYHLERALANNDTVDGLAHKVKVTGARTFRARAITGGGLAATAAAGLYGVNKYTDHQNEKARRNLYAMLEMQKQAGLLQGTAPLLSQMGRITRSFTNSAVDLANTAHGGKVKEFAQSKFGADTPNFKKFVQKSKRRQEAFTLAKLGRGSRDELRNLRADQRAAQIGLYGPAAATAYAYHKGKTKGINEAYGY